MGRKQVAGFGRFLPIDLVAGHQLEDRRDRLDIVAVEVVQDSDSVQ
jgi:hypothetical protein